MSDLIAVAERLRERTRPLRFDDPVTHVYAPLDYAWAPHRRYLERYGTRTPREVLFVGMNPGPFGMAQNGVPFGDTAMVRDWLGIEAPVGSPDREHPKRPVLGFRIRRGEVSGARLWGWARERFGAPERFFGRAFVWNYCPLCFMSETGRNVTPDKLPAAERHPSSRSATRRWRRWWPTSGRGRWSGSAGSPRAGPPRLRKRPACPWGPPPIRARRARPRTVAWPALFEAALRDLGIDLDAPAG